MKKTSEIAFELRQRDLRLAIIAIDWPASERNTIRPDVAVLTNKLKRMRKSDTDIDIH